MRSSTDALYLVHAPDGRRLAYDRAVPALAVALLLSVVHGAPVRVDVGRQRALSDPRPTLDAPRRVGR